MSEFFKPGEDIPMFGKLKFDRPAKTTEKMGNMIKPINPGQTIPIGSKDHLTQVQHKGTYVDIVDHFDKGPNPVKVHIVTRVNKDGTLDINIE